MNDLPSEVLLSVFKSLESKEMAKVMRTCRNWYKIIDDNVSAWNAFVLERDYDEDYVDFEEGLKRFRIKSGGLKEVCIEAPFSMEEWDTDVHLEFCQELEKNKGSLQYLDLSKFPSDTFSHTCSHEWILSDLAWKIPSLVDFRFKTRGQGHCIGSNSVRFLHSKLSSRAKQVSDKVPSLRIFWGWGSKELLGRNLKVLSNLTSLCLGISLTSNHWKQVLIGPSQTLKHLRLRFLPDGFITETEPGVWKGETLPEPRSAGQSIEYLNFPALEVFEFEPCEPDFPIWMRIPPTSTLILIAQKVKSIAQYPKIHQLWIKKDTEFFNINSLSSACPSLERLRFFQRHYDHQVPLSKIKTVSEMLSERKSAAEAGLKVDGIQVRAIKQLTLDLEGMEAATLEELKKLVPEVLNSRKSPRYIDIEVEI